MCGGVREWDRLFSPPTYTPSTSQSHRTNYMKPEATQFTGIEAALVMYGTHMTLSEGTVFLFFIIVNIYSDV